MNHVIYSTYDSLRFPVLRGGVGASDAKSHVVILSISTKRWVIKLSTVITLKGLDLNLKLGYDVSLKLEKYREDLWFGFKWQYP